MEQVFSSLLVRRGATDGVAFVFLNRPSRANALDEPFFAELPRCVQALDSDPSVRVVVLAAKGKHFCSGIDLTVLGALLSSPSKEADVSSDPSTSSHGSCPGREREALRRGILSMQAAVSSLDQCRKPVIAAIHGACLGGGVDLVTACDFRYCTDSAVFSVREVDLALVADLGTLQRLPRIIGEGSARELAITARNFDGREALRLGLVQKTFPSEEQLLRFAEEVAGNIAGKSPLAVVGTKHVMNVCRGLSVDSGLEYVATWNSAMLLSSDIQIALDSAARKSRPHFSKL